MVNISNKIKSIINTFIDESKALNINFEQVFLFGSYAKGTEHEYSDIDLAVVSSKFVGNRYYDIDKIRRPKLKASTLLEVHPFVPEDFNIDNPFVQEIINTGIKII
ncbi:MAG: nucleotidyltransferase [Ignavibacteria bacterium]|nr:nucleotidyltransferase [Ignavibacteria bacterium]